MTVALEHLDRDELRRKIEDGDDFVLVDARSPIAFAHAHLPGAVNLTRQWVAERAAWRIRDLDTETIVYCTNVECDAAEMVAALLVDRGYRNVRHYAGGIEDWVEAGLPLEQPRTA
jgi:rhodanese-related sulfurtransferase